MVRVCWIFPHAVIKRSMSLPNLSLCPLKVDPTWLLFYIKVCLGQSGRKWVVSMGNPQFDDFPMKKPPVPPPSLDPENKMSSLGDLASFHGLASGWSGNWNLKTKPAQKEPGICIMGPAIYFHVCTFIYISKYIISICGSVHWIPRFWRMNQSENCSKSRKKHTLGPYGNGLWDRSMILVVIGLNHGVIGVWVPVPTARHPFWWHWVGHLEWQWAPYAAFLRTTGEIFNPCLEYLGKFRNWQSCFTLQINVEMEPHRL